MTKTLCDSQLTEKRILSNVGLFNPAGVGARLFSIYHPVLPDVIHV